MPTRTWALDNHDHQNTQVVNMATLEKWQLLQSSWSQAFHDAKAAESILNARITEHLKNAVDAPSAHDLDTMMHCWLEAAKSLTAMDEFIAQHIAVKTNN